MILRLFKDALFKFGPVMTTKNPICIILDTIIRHKGIKVNKNVKHT